MKNKLDITLLKSEAKTFCAIESKYDEPSLYGVTDGKAVGTYLEHKFKSYLTEKYQYEIGNSASGIDFPCLNVDMKVTSSKQPQSSCPFKSVRQKIYGLGYSLIIFVYEKKDNQLKGTTNLNIKHSVYVEKEYTADYQTTSGVCKLIENNANIDDIVSFLFERNLPVDDIEAYKIAQDILDKPPKVGYLTISNALQWRLQYSRIISLADQVNGVVRIC